MYYRNTKKCGSYFNSKIAYNTIKWWDSLKHGYSKHGEDLSKPFPDPA